MDALPGKPEDPVTYWRTWARIHETRSRQSRRAMLLAVAALHRNNRMKALNILTREIERPK
jgi:hypothetical protein